MYSNWYKKAAKLGDFFTANITEEQRVKKDILAEQLGFSFGSIVSKSRKQNNSSLGDAIDTIYNRVEMGQSPISCMSCRWYVSKPYPPYNGKPSCNNTNWTGEPHGIDNGPCYGISWETDELV